MSFSYLKSKLFGSAPAQAPTRSYLPLNESDSDSSGSRSPPPSYNHLCGEDTHGAFMLAPGDLEKQSPSPPDTDADADADADTPSDRSAAAPPKPRFRVDARVLSDLIIGLSDGLTVPFALTAGLSALGSTKVVIYGGMAELIAGAISMGLGGYLGAKSEEESYTATTHQLTHQLTHSPHQTSHQISTLLHTLSLPAPLHQSLHTHLQSHPQTLHPLLLRFTHNLPVPAPPSRALTAALTIALGYFVGGFVPLVPYFFVGGAEVSRGLAWSAGVMVGALWAFGVGKRVAVEGWPGEGGGEGWEGGDVGGVDVGEVEGGQGTRAWNWRPWWECCKAGLVMVVVGSCAAGAAMGLVVLFRWAEGEASG